MIENLKHCKIIIRSAAGVENIDVAAAAALDALAEEPIRKNHPLLGMDQVVLTPRCAWYSETSMGKLLVSAAEEVVRALRHPAKPM